MKLLIGWIIAGACVAGSLVVVLHHLLQLRSFPDTARRRYMIGVVLMAPARARPRPRARGPRG